MLRAPTLTIIFWNCRGIKTSEAEIDNLQESKGDLIFLSETLCGPRTKVFFHNWEIALRMDYPNEKKQKFGGNRGLMVLKRKGLQIELSCTDSSVKESYCVIEVGGTRLMHVYAEPEENTESIIERWIRVIMNNHKEELLLFGDINSDPKNPKRVKSFNRIRDALELNDLIHVECPSVFTFVGNNGSSQIDHLFRHKSLEVREYSSVPELQSSDHEALSFTISLRATIVENYKKNKINKSWGLSKINSMNKEQKKKFVDESKGELQDFCNDLIVGIDNLTQSSFRITQEIIDDAYGQFIQHLREQAIKYIGYKDNRPKIPDFLTPVMHATKRALRAMKKGIRQCKDQLILNRQLSRISALRKEYMNLISDRKKELTLEYYKKIQYMPLGDVLKLSRRAERALNTPNNAQLRPTMEAVEEYFTIQYKEGQQEDQLPKRSRRSYGKSEVTEMTEVEVMEIIKKMPNAKAPGPDKLPIEIFKTWIDVITPVITKLFNWFTATRFIPTEWRRGLIYPIYKQGKDITKAESYRPISLLNHIRKVYEKCLMRRTQQIFTEKLSQSQFGFIQKRSTTDAILVLDAVLKKKRGTAHVAFMDIKGAYDNVSRPLLWDKLKPILCREYYEAIKNLFDENYMQISRDNNIGRPIKLEKGLTQGSIMAPILYNMYMNDLKSKSATKNGILWRTENERMKLHIIQYADDIALVANNRDDLVSMIAKCEEHSENNLYSYSFSKCVAFTDSDISIGGNVIARQESFNYLGIPITRRGINQNLFFEDLIKKAEQVTQKAISTRMLRYLSTPMKLKFYKQMLRPKLEYGLGLMTKQKVYTDTIDTKVHRILCSFIGTNIAISKVGLRVTMGISSTEERRATLWHKTKERLNTIMPSHNNIAAKIYQSMSMKAHKLSAHSPRLTGLVTTNYDNNTKTDWNKFGFKRLKEPTDPNKLITLWQGKYRWCQLYIVARFPGEMIQCKLCDKKLVCFVKHATECDKTKGNNKTLDNIYKLASIGWENLRTEERDKIEVILKFLFITYDGNRNSQPTADRQRSRDFKEIVDSGTAI